MKLDEFVKFTIKDFRKRSNSKNVVLLYPWTNYRTLFVAYFDTNSDNREFLYYRINEDFDTLAQWLDAFVTELSQSVPNFGAEVKKLLPKGKPDKLGEAFAKDLANHSQDPFALFIDELDRVPLDKAFKTFIASVVANMPSYAQLVISSRKLTYQPWYDMVAAGKAVILGTERRKDDGRFTVVEQSKPRLEVYALGKGYAFVNGEEINQWDGALPRNLFFYFMDNPLVTRDEIFAVFWPNLPIKEATNVFHVTKRKISERIGLQIDEEGDYELTKYSAGFYMPSEKLIRHYDVADFQTAIEQAMVTTDEQEEESLLEQAIELYRAPFLQTVSMPWADERRRALQQLGAQAHISMGRLNKKRNKPEEALSSFIRALKETPEREDIHREVMNLYAGMGDIEAARAQYHHLEAILHDTVNIEPSRETRDLFKTIDAKV